MVAKGAVLVVAVCLLSICSAVKFTIEAHHSPTAKCLWNYALSDTLVVISVSAPLQGTLQRLDMEIVDGSGSRNVYQHKKGIKGETRMAVTTHADADLGVCFMNKLDPSVPENQAHKYSRSVDLDVDIGADAVDYNAIAKQESLSGLEVEMRKLEGVVKEIVEELNYLKRREAMMRDTNGKHQNTLSLHRYTPRLGNGNRHATSRVRSLRTSYPPTNTPHRSDPTCPGQMNLCRSGKSPTLGSRAGWAGGLTAGVSEFGL